MPRRITKTSKEIGSIHIDQAARPQKPPVGGDFHRDHLLNRPRPVRAAGLPEPVDVPRMVNGRRLESWERVLYREWAHRERRRELAMFAGLIG